MYVLGDTFPELGGSEFAEVVLGRVAGRPPALDLELEAALVRLLGAAARADLLASAHDCSEGGLAVALAESAIDGDTGFAVTIPGDLPPHVALFSESASRAVVAAREGRDGQLDVLAADHGVPLRRIGATGGSRLRFEGLFEAELTDALVVYEGAIPKLMASGSSAG